MAAEARRRGRLGVPFPRGGTGDRAPAGRRGTGRKRAIAAARQEAIGRFGDLLATGRALRPAQAPRLPAGTERHLVLGAAAVFSGRVRAGDTDRLPELASEVAEMLAAPYAA